MASPRSQAVISLSQRRFPSPPISVLKRFETVDEIASVVVFVCSPLAARMNGSSIRVEGGLVKAIA